MLAFVTGASSGIGRDIAKKLSEKGYDLIITARDEDKLLELKKEIESNAKVKIKIFLANLEKEEEIFGLYEKVKDEKIDVFINNAGFGIIGEFWNTDLQAEISMLKVNDMAMHILFKLILKDMIKATSEAHLTNAEKSSETFQNLDVFQSSNTFQNSDVFQSSNTFQNSDAFQSSNTFQNLDVFQSSNTFQNSNIFQQISKTKNEKYILNVASLSGYMPGPLMSAYYATKAYMLNLTRGVYKELKMAKLDKKINVSVLCPGPVYTNFADRAGVVFKLKNLTSEYTAKYAINKLFAKKLVIVPGFLNKCGHILSKIIPSKIVMAVTYRIQKKK